jgi:hypothetical protein
MGSTGLLACKVLFSEYFIYLCISYMKATTIFYVLVLFFHWLLVGNVCFVPILMNSMFNNKIVGLKNGMAGGLGEWGNLGGGETQLIIPFIYELIHKIFNSTPFTAWRISFLITWIRGVYKESVHFESRSDSYESHSNENRWCFLICYGQMTKIGRRIVLVFSSASRWQCWFRANFG